MPPPAPAVPPGAGATGSAAAAAPSPEEQFFTPTVLQPITHLAPAAPAHASLSPGKKLVAAFLVVAFVVAAGATVWLGFGPGQATQHQTAEVLAPRPPTVGLPTSLDVIVRVEAESARHTALETIEAGGTADLADLASEQPNYTWIVGDKASSDPKTVSVAEDAATVTIAVAASNHDVCAFGRWAPNSTPVYVTMAHEDACAAVHAPASGWSTEPGGAASDLPDDATG